jgi:hypothetical protein
LSAWQEERDRLARELAEVETAAAAGEEFVTRVVDALYTIQRLETELSGADPERARDVLACVVESVTPHFRHGKPRKDGRLRTKWTEYELRWVPDFAAYMDLPDVTRVPVGDWKKYPIGNLTFEEIEARERQRGKGTEAVGKKVSRPRRPCVAQSHGNLGRDDCCCNIYPATSPPEFGRRSAICWRYRQKYTTAVRAAASPRPATAQTGGRLAPQRVQKSTRNHRRLCREHTRRVHVAQVNIATPPQSQQYIFPPMRAANKSSTD